jgi:hypothetical protein
MRFAVVICFTTLALLAPTAANAKSARTGRLVGSTELSVGCPVVSQNVTCNPWRLYPHASFTLTRLDASGAAVAGTARTIESNSNARFHIKLHPGSYLITPLAGSVTTGGSTVSVRVKTHKTKTTTVRFAAKHRVV